MLDLKRLRENPDELRQALASRHHDLKLVDELVKLDESWRSTKTYVEQLKAKRNTLGMHVAKLKKENASPEQVTSFLQGTKNLADEILQRDADCSAIENQMKQLILQLPNYPDASVPKGKDEKDNPVIRTHGQPGKSSKDVLPHYDLGERERVLDFARGSRMSGHRFCVTSGWWARLERALIYFFLEQAQAKGYKEIAPPHLVLAKTMQGSGQLPKFADESYFCAGDKQIREETSGKSGGHGRMGSATNASAGMAGGASAGGTAANASVDALENLALIPTSEVPLCALHAGEIFEQDAIFPLKYCAYSPCYRREAGAYGKDIKGYIRQHQFNKVELFKFTLPEESKDELEKLTADAEDLLQQLGLAYRTIELCTGDMGFSAAKTYDIEVWLPSQDKHREISSCSNCTDFQARRSNIRYRHKGEMKFVHTLNGSGLAVGRAAIAVVENFQDKDGLDIPKPLQDFMHAKRIEFERIEK